MGAELHKLSFSGSMLVRGFWLYVWEVITENEETKLYIGMTGDIASLKAQSPFNRMSQHLGLNKHANALRRHLEKNKITSESCKAFDMVAYGPIFDEGDAMDDHRFRCSWAKVFALEKALADALHDSGYTVLNTVNCQREPDQQLWDTVKEVFAQRFPKLNPRNLTGGVK